MVANFTLVASALACLRRKSASAWSALLSAETPTVLPSRSLIVWIWLAVLGAVTTANSGSRPVTAKRRRSACTLAYAWITTSREVAA